MYLLRHIVVQFNIPRYLNKDISFIIREDVENNIMDII